MSLSLTSTAIGDGESFDVFDPDMAVVTPHRLARVLSHICRFNGHTPQFYSVAQHSVIVSKALWSEFRDYKLALEGLMHDAAEAFIADLPRPIKHADGFDSYRELDDNLTAMIFDYYGIEFPLDPRVKEADNRTLMTERRDLRMTGGALWPEAEPYDWFTISPLPSEEAAKTWLQTFELFANGKPS